MADIELVIKLSEEDYKNCIEYDALTSSIYKAIQNGTPLPKGQGMKLIVDIDDKTYETIKNAEPLKWDCPIESAYKAIKNGTPLPKTKSHGRLIILSEDTLKREQTSLSFSCQNWISEVGLSNATVATIEADKEDKE